MQKTFCVFPLSTVTFITWMLMICIPNKHHASEVKYLGIVKKEGAE